ncbi:hypothetical protein OROHE_005836 [Orobanche hederae]
MIHGMQLWSGSGSGMRVSLVKKKQSSPRGIKRPDQDDRSSGKMVLRPKQISPPAEKTPALREPLPAPYEGDDPEEMKRNAEERSKCLSRGFEYVHLVKERSISPKGFTQRELSICRSYMLKKNFEMDGLTPKAMESFKSFLDQVRASPYGVTMDYPGGIIRSSFKPYKRKLQKGDPAVKGYVEDMTKKLLGPIKRKRGQVYTSLGAENLVRVSWSYFLLTLRVQLRTDPETPRVVEALFYQKPEPVW